MPQTGVPSPDDQSNGGSLADGRTAAAVRQARFFGQKPIFRLAEVGLPASALQQGLSLVEPFVEAPRPCPFCRDVEKHEAVGDNDFAAVEQGPES
jgi:hypothetical protein